MDITLLQFQYDAICRLLEEMEGGRRDIVLKSCTGSGKTIILTHFMYEYFKTHSKTVFVWLTPGKGDLEEQSKEKMDKYVRWSQTKLLSDVMTSGFSENDACFINWEKLTKKGNNALKDSERTNFREYIEKAQNEGLSFKIIVDESHQNDTIKSSDILSYFNSDKIIRTSATPKEYKDATVIEIKEEIVISQELIKKVLIINEDFAKNIHVKDQISYLLDKALAKQADIYSKMQSIGKDINPLIIVQIPNKNEDLQNDIVQYFESKGITFDNQRLAIWLSKQKENLENIVDNSAASIALIIKQAVATGWDCPRAYILVKLRDNMDETFEIQTIGRIRRMPEAQHYETSLLDSCYLFTLDTKFTESVKTSLGKGALDAATISLKPEHKKFTLKSQQRKSLPEPIDSRHVLSAIEDYFQKKYSINFFPHRIDITASSSNEKLALQNQKILNASGYVFTKDIKTYTKQGEVNTLENAKNKFAELDNINIVTPLNTHKHGRQFHHHIAEIGLKVHLDYDQILTIIRKLFDTKSNHNNKILTLELREVYSFVLNNAEKLKHDIRSSMSSELKFAAVKPDKIRTVDFTFPQTILFTYDGTNKTQEIYTKNVYANYRSSAEPRSTPEKEFEEFLEKAISVIWFY
ncbi:MAG: DEAD/DEAH box helicase family protein [Treponema sp.]|jgi:type III restriction enzyme|nr:DEAD/DEAH box helicase family protein [Treponema sp.]